MKFFIDTCGWIGMIMVVAGFYLVSNGRISAQTNLFQVINVIAAIFIGSNAYYYGAWPSVGLNAVWLLIAVMTLIRINSGPQKNAG